MNPDLNRLEHMIDACNKIIQFTAVDYSVYENSEEKQAAVARYFEILGEAANKISDDLKKQHPNIPWRVATCLRNILIHDYVKVDYSELWKTAKEDIPSMLPELQSIFSSLL